MTWNISFCLPPPPALYYALRYHTYHSTAVYYRRCSLLISTCLPVLPALFCIYAMSTFSATATRVLSAITVTYHYLLVILTLPVC